jgi:hypothetical protein
MFRVSFFVEDKHLAPVMHGLAGVAKDLQVVPVANAVAGANGTVAAKAGSAVELIVKEIKARKVEGFTPDLLRAAIKKAGLNPNSFGYFVKQLRAANAITTTGKGAKVIYALVKS